MEAMADYACCLLAAMFRWWVEPVAAALDGTPRASAFGGGRHCGSAERAAAIRVQVSLLCAPPSELPSERAEARAAYLAARELLGDILRAAAADLGGGPAAPASEV